MRFAVNTDGLGAVDSPHCGRPQRTGRPSPARKGSPTRAQEQVPALVKQLSTELKRVLSAKAGLRLKDVLGDLRGLLPRTRAVFRIVAGEWPPRELPTSVADLLPILNRIADGMEILGIAWGGPTMLTSTLSNPAAARRLHQAFAGLSDRAGSSGVIPWLVASVREESPFADTRAKWRTALAKPTLNGLQETSTLLTKALGKKLAALSGLTKLIQSWPKIPRPTTDSDSTAVDTSGWYAWINKMPPGPPSFHVSGTVHLPSPGHEAKLSMATPQGVNPSELILNLSVTMKPGVWPEVVTPVSVRHDVSSYDGSYSSVLVRHPGGGAKKLPVETVY